MNRKIFMFERKPTYQEDPSFYAERVVGTVNNVFKREYTSNQTEKVYGQFTGVDVTVNVPNSVPVCDRVHIGTHTVMLTSFTVSPGGSVNIQSGSTLVQMGDTTDYKYIIVRSGPAGSSQNVPTGYYYKVIPSDSEVLFENAEGVLFTTRDVATNDTTGIPMKIYKNVLGFVI